MFEILVSKEKIERLKRGKANSEIYVVKYLPRAHMLAILDDTNFRILTRELELSQEIPPPKNKKEKVLTFCLNMAVYRAQSSGSSA